MASLLLLGSCLEEDFSSFEADCEYIPQPPHAVGELKATVRVLTANVYGQSQNSLSDFLFTGDEVCQTRLKQVGAYLRDVQPRFDIVGLQEWHSDSVSTCNGVVLKNRVDDSFQGPIKEPFAPQEGYEFSHIRWSHPHAYGQTDGGIGIISKEPFYWQNYGSGDFEDTFVDSANVVQFHPRLKPRSAHGFVFARIYQHYPDIAIDTYIVHVNATLAGPDQCDDACKVFMLEQLREGIHERSAESGFPVIVMGDFNIGGPNPPAEGCLGNPGYTAIMKNLGNPIDVWPQAHPGESGSTYNWWNENPRRLDYIFIPNDPYLTNSEYELVLLHDSVQTVDWGALLNQSNPSDHRGLKATIEIRQKVSSEHKGNLRGR